MRFRRDKNKVRIEIDFDKATEELKVKVEPKSTRPTEIIQVFMLAINVINQILQKELKKKQKEEKKPKQLVYIG